MENILGIILRVNIDLALAKRPYYILFYLLWGALLLSIGSQGFALEAASIFISSTLWTMMALPLYPLLSLPIQKNNKLQAALQSRKKVIHWLLNGYLVFLVASIILYSIDSQYFRAACAVLTFSSLIYIFIALQLISSNLVAAFLEQYETLELATFPALYSEVRSLLLTRHSRK